MIVGVSPSIRRAVALAERYARTRLPVLIVGETGTGKELLAEFIHERSGRPGPFVDVNCCALPRDMVESLLFGHLRGAFTGAVESREGHIERSDGGTLFLDELASLAPEAQGKLLRVLETGQVQPLGAAGKRRVDLRLLSTAQEHIGRALASGQFRRDLYQRAAGVVIKLSALSARPEDIVPLARHFAALRGQRLEPGAEAVLRNYSWPGNIRELRFVIERAGEAVENGTLPASAVTEAIDLGNSGPALSSRSAVASKGSALSRDDILRALRRCDGNVRCAAATLGIGRTTFFKRLRTLGISLRAASQSSLVQLGSRELP